MNNTSFEVKCLPPRLIIFCMEVCLPVNMNPLRKMYNTYLPEYMYIPEAKIKDPFFLFYS